MAFSEGFSVVRSGLGGSKAALAASVHYMDNNSSGEDLVIKTRKPYTITKQRERWTEEEHNRFLDALKLYGRAWQRIEEHIGTKTAVQIRSHAQKFFTKLEKEAVVKGVPMGRALDIEIPPPRPKRKPSNPYPRKTGVGTPTPQVGAKDGKNLSPISSYCTSKQILDLEREPLLRYPCSYEKPGNAEGNLDEGNCSEVLTLFQEDPCTSLSSANKDSMRTSVTPRYSCTFRDFVPMMVHTEDETNESCATVEPKGNKKMVKLDASDTSNLENSNPSHEKLVQGKKINERSLPENFGALPSSDMQASQNYPRHVPVHVLNGTLGNITENVSPDMSFQESIFHQMGGVHPHPNLFINPAASAASTEQHINTSRSSIPQSFPPFHPLFTPVHNNQEDYQSDLHLSSTFLSLIASTLLQNPAAHAAASFAATFWPCTTMEASADSPVGNARGFPSRQMNPSPSVAAIAAATVAAATAWWASHGLLSMCTPFHTGFTCTPETTTATLEDAGLAAAAGNDGKSEKPPSDLPLQNQQLDPEYSEALQEQHSASKSPTLLSSDSEECEGENPSFELTAAKQENTASATELHDSNKIKDKKQVDRSSCGSNTASSSDVETDALEKHEKDKEELKEPDISHAAGDSNNRRSRSSSSTNDSWKEVSEEGRLAFRALFSRQVLPQSFSPPHDLKNKEYQKTNVEMDRPPDTNEKAEDAMQLDLNFKIWGACSSHQLVEKSKFLRGENDGEGLLRMELGYGRLKPCRTGFKPYKRCSVEAKEESNVATASNQGEEKCPKRIRLEGEAST
ncbi:protein LATE ELONGATED HYPOCOTYL-like [Actinidia eriantha]|uniref:protein LATE ELONGATED HYPOCOTYL-like n=1 Tax=Actinidia eriantha TaxID=165200 RepID=UPI002590BA30|nr:protein LATE ELONGATED HYPOCOTYL-like [Actinidia eriantha]